MNETEQNNKVAELEQKIRDLQSQLSSSNSPIGDWKVSKCMEYEVVGLECPYDVKELHKARQAVRDEINQIQNEIAALNSSISTVEV